MMEQSGQGGVVLVDITFHFAEDSRTPYYQQLYEFIRDEISSGLMRAGTRLPSIRDLSISLRISKTTVEDAYQQLVAEGYIASRPRVGYFSLPPDETFNVPRPARPIQVQSAPRPAHPLIEIDFHPARIDVSHFPHTIWRKLYNEVWTDMDRPQHLLSYGDPQGEWGLRAQIASYLYSSRGVRSTPEQIVMGSGMHFSVQLLWQLLKPELGMAAMEDPGYDKIRALLEGLGVRVYAIPLDEDGVSVKHLRYTNANLAYVTPSHQFPTGCVMSYTKRRQLLQWASERGGWILEDDYDGEFRYTEKPIPSLQGMDSHDSVIYMGTFSKSLMPSIRMNYMVLPNPLLHRLTLILQTFDSPVSRLEQAVLERFMERGYWEKHIRRMRRVYRKKHELLVHAIRSELKNAELSGHGAGLHVSLTLKHGPPGAAELIKGAESVGVKLYTLGQAPGIPETVPSSPVVYLGFGDLTHAQIEEGVKRLKTVWS